MQLVYISFLHYSLLNKTVEAVFLHYCEVYLVQVGITYRFKKKNETRQKGQSYVWEDCK